MKTRAVLPALLFGALILVPHTASAQAVSADPQNGAVQGTVTSAEEQAPLQRANLVLTDLEGEPTPYGAMSLKDGSYVVGNIPPGDYVLRVAAMGYRQERSGPFTVRAGVALSLDFSLRRSPSTGTIAGRVIDADTGEPIPAANVVLLKTDGSATDLGAFTDESGRYVIMNVPPGRYTLKALTMGYQPVLVERLLVGTGSTTTHNFRLAPIGP